MVPSQLNNRLVFINPGDLIGGFNPSEKYESQLG